MASVLPIPYHFVCDSGSHDEAAEALNEGGGSPENEEGMLLGEQQSVEDRAEEHDRPHRTRTRTLPPPLRKLQRLRSTLNLDQLAKNEQELKANLYFHISNPIKRWRVEKQLPIKLLLQVLKTFCLIVQVRNDHLMVKQYIWCAGISLHEVAQTATHAVLTNSIFEQLRSCN